MMKRSLRRALALTLAALMLLALAACGQKAEPPKESDIPTDSPSPSDTAAPTDSPEEGLVPGSVFKYWLNMDFPQYLPWMDLRNSNLSFQIYDNLLYQNPDNLEEVLPCLAESYEVSDDGLVWTFKIREDAMFATGNPVTPEAFVKSWDAAKEYQPHFFATVASYEATGDNELTITLSSPDPVFRYKLPVQPQVAPVDPELLEQYGPEANEAAIGAGAYYVTDYKSGERFTLKANPYYNHPDRMPQIETVEMVIIPDENTALIALMNGELDLMNTVNMEVYNNLAENGWDVVITPDRVYPTWLNAREVELFRDPAVREALSHMVDWDAISNLVYDGLWPAASTDFEGMDAPYGDEHKYDPELGLQMLADAGYQPEDIVFSIQADPDMVDVSVAIQAQLNDLGLVNVGVDTMDGATCYGMLKAGTYQVVAIHNGYDPLNPLTPFSMGLPIEGTQRVMWMEYMDEAAHQEALAVYEQAKSATTWEDYKGYVSELTRMEQEMCCSMGGLYWQRFVCINPDFTGMHPRALTGIPEICYLRVAA